MLSATYEPLSNEEIRLKYPPAVAEKMIENFNAIEVLYDEYNSDKFSINIKQELYITKKKENADFKVKISKTSDAPVEIIKELKDPANTHKYNYGIIPTVVNERLKKQGLRLGYSKGFNTYVLSLFIDFYDIKKDSKYAYKHVIGKTKPYTYSEQLIEFIIDEIKKNPEGFVDSLKNKKR